MNDIPRFHVCSTKLKLFLMVNTFLDKHSFHYISSSTDLNICYLHYMLYINYFQLTVNIKRVFTVREKALLTHRLATTVLCTKTNSSV